MTEPGVHLRWPSDRFAWCVIDAPGVRRSGVLPPAYLLDLAEEVPANIDDLFAVAVPISNGEVVVCAALRSELASLDENVISLTPESLPDGVFASLAESARTDFNPAILNLLVGEFPDGVFASLAESARTDFNPAILNLLVGEYEPRIYRRARHRRHTLAAALVLLAALIATAGLLRRSAHWKQVTEESRTAAADLLSRAVTNGDERALERELIQRRAAARASGALAAPPDAGLTLAQLLTAWPADVPSKPQSIAITPSGTGSSISGSTSQSVAVSVSVEGNPADFLNVFRTPIGWTMDEPRLNTAGSITRLSLTLHPSGKATTTATLTSKHATLPSAASTASLSKPEGSTP